MSTIYTGFPSSNLAEQAKRALLDQGVSQSDVNVLSADQAGGNSAALSVKLPSGKCDEALGRQILAKYEGRDYVQGAATVQSGASVIPIVQEELVVGKREVQAGGVRVETHMSERKVEEDINLREEAIHVERRPVDRPATEADLNPLPHAVEVRAVGEEAVIAKNARVVEEVLVSKDVSQRTQHVSDTVRRTEVDVHPLQQQFRQDFETRFKGKNLQFEQTEPAYSYGYELRSNPQFSGKNWSSIEPDVQSSWSGANPGRNWSDYREAVHYGYEQK